MLPPPPIRGLFRTDHRARAAYAEGAGIFRILPAAVCVPLDREDLASLAHWASAHRVPLVPRGAGSAMGGGNVGDGRRGGSDRVCPAGSTWTAAARRARAGASVTLAELNAAADRAGLRLPPDPSSGRWATLGGHALDQRRRRAHRALRQRAPLGGGARAGHRRRRGRSSSAAAQPAAAGRRGSSGSRPRRRRPSWPRRELVRARFPRTRKNASGYALDAWLDSGTCSIS